MANGDPIEKFMRNMAKLNNQQRMLDAMMKGHLDELQMELEDQVQAGQIASERLAQLRTNQNVQSVVPFIPRQLPAPQEDIPITATLREVPFDTTVTSSTNQTARNYALPQFNNIQPTTVGVIPYNQSNTYQPYMYGNTPVALNVHSSSGGNTYQLASGSAASRPHQFSGNSSSVQHSSLRNQSYSIPQSHSSATVAAAAPISMSIQQSHLARSSASAANVSHTQYRPPSNLRPSSVDTNDSSGMVTAAAPISMSIQQSHPARSSASAANVSHTQYRPPSNPRPSSVDTNDSSGTVTAAAPISMSIQQSHPARSSASAANVSHTQYRPPSNPRPSSVDTNAGASNTSDNHSSTFNVAHNSSISLPSASTSRPSSVHSFGDTSTRSYLDNSQARMLQQYFIWARELAKNSPPGSHVPFGKNGIFIQKGNTNDITFVASSTDGWRTMTNRELLQRMTEPSKPISQPTSQSTSQPRDARPQSSVTSLPLQTSTSQLPDHIQHLSAPVRKSTPPPTSQTLPSIQPQQPIPVHHTSVRREQVSTLQPSSGAQPNHAVALEMVQSTTSSARSTPVSVKSSGTSSSLTPRDANKKSLAADILRAFGKRPRTDDAALALVSERESKRQALDRVMSVPPVHSELQGSEASSIMQSSESETKPLAIPNTVHYSRAINYSSPLPPSRLMMIAEPSPFGNTITQTQAAASTNQPTLDISSPVRSHDNLANPTTPSSSSMPPAGNDPLFLPSPPSSPAIKVDIGSRDSEEEVVDLTVDEPPESEAEDIPKLMAESAGKIRFDRSRVWVEVPPAPEYIKRWKAQQKRKRFDQVESDDGVEIIELEIPSNRLKSEERSEAADVHSVPSYFGTNLEELAVANQSITRIREMPCHWGNCDVVLNTAAKLDNHIKTHCQTNKKMGFKCQWRQCGRYFPSSQRFLHHLRSHALSSLWCPYQGCEETFRSTRELLRHKVKSHANGTLKSSAEPFVPNPVQLPDAPSRVPSYMMVSKPVIPHEISKERHDLLSVWVLKNMMPPANVVVGLKLIGAKRGSDPPVATNQYDFVLSRQSRSCMPSRPAKVRDLGDLNSEMISSWANSGATLWKVPP
ncbi:hypothetical protein VKT23_001690 [Stygiomarasmius scandens]|uniref:C2H2-type domain-containing protein n=1 Tax=Marasmiellus scandens TaxID=2682957 RepID=A0ABR1K1Q7_9AGAR